MGGAGGGAGGRPMGGNTGVCGGAGGCDGGGTAGCGGIGVGPAGFIGIGGGVWGPGGDGPASTDCAGGAADACSLMPCNPSIRTMPMAMRPA